VQVTLYVNVGQAWNTRPSTPSPKILASIGLGLRWAATMRSPLLVRFQFELFLGAALEPCQNFRGDLQVLGLYLPLVVALF
jgi:hemolysin activation/secretion protein